MANLIITRPPQFLDPWFVEIEQVWDEIEAAVNDNDARISTLETAILTDVVTSVSKQGDPQLQGDVTFTGVGLVNLTQVGTNIEFSVSAGSIDHGSLAGLGDDDHTQYILAAGTRAFTGNQSFGNNQATSFRVENVVVLPGAGNQGRLVFDQNTLSLKVDDGTAFVEVGITDHGALTGLSDDDHPQYVLVDGSRNITGAITMESDATVQGILEVQDKYTNEANESLLLESKEDDGASSVAFIMDTTNLLSTAGAKLLSVRNQGVEKFYIDKDGVISGGLSSDASINILIDTDNDSTTEALYLKKDDPDEGLATTVMSVNEAGELNLPQVTSGIRVGSTGSPSHALDIDGDADISGELILSVSGIIKSPSNMSFQVDTDDDEAASFTWLDGLGATILTLAEDGTLTTVADLSLGGNLLLGDTSSIIGTGSMVFQVDSDDDDSAVYQWLNDLGQTVMSLDEDGNLDIGGTLSGGSSPFKFQSNAELEGAYAFGTIQIIDNTFDAGDSVTITDPELNDYTFEQGVDFTPGVDAIATASDLANAINTHPTLSTKVEASSGGTDTVTITSSTIGTYGNGFAMSESDGATDNFTLSGANFSGGTDVPTIAYELDTLNDLIIGGSKLLSLKNQGVEKAYLDYRGYLRTQAGMQINAGGVFTGGGTLTIGNGAVTSQGITFLSTTQALISAGDMIARFLLPLGSGGPTFEIAPQVDVADGIDVFKVYNNSGAETLLRVRGSGDLEILGTLIGGSSPFRVESKESDGPTAIAYELDTQNALSTAGAKLLSLKNDGVEVFSIDKDGVTSGGLVFVAKPADGGAGIKAAILEAIAAGGGTVQLLAGTYAITSQLLVNYIDNLNNVTIQGMGESTILDLQTTGVSYPIQLEGRSVTTNDALNNFTAGDTSVFTTTPGDANGILEGDTVQILFDNPDGEREIFLSTTIANGDGGTGEVQLDDPLPKDGTSAQFLRVTRDGVGVSIKNLKITQNASATGIHAALYLLYLRRLHIEHVVVEDIAHDSTENGIGIYSIHCYEMKIRNCKFLRCKESGVTLSNAYDGIINGCFVSKCATGSEFHRNGIRIRDNSTKCSIQNCRVYNTNGKGIYLHPHSGRTCSKINIVNNHVGYSDTDGIYASGCYDINIKGNQIDGTGAVGIYTGSSDRVVVSENILRNLGGSGIYNQTSGDSCVFSNNVVEKATAYGIIMSSGGNSCISSNIVKDAAYGIQISATNRASVTGNTLQTLSTVGIRVSTVIAASIVGNTIEGATLGINVENTADDCIISSNNCKGQGINKGTGNNVFLGNIE